MSDTSRNDEVMKYCFGDDSEFVAVKHYERLQRELAEARKQRDTLAKTVRVYLDTERDGGILYSDALSELQEALAAVKG
jgi:hypothetical protein